jgi:hypothetical protein
MRLVAIGPARGGGGYPLELREEIRLTAPLLTTHNSQQTCPFNLLPTLLH